MVRALQLLLGLILATGGGWFIWLRKDSPGGIFNVTDTETLWLVAMGLVLALLGLVLFLMGLSPRAKVEQINWRYPEPAPEVDLSGPAFADMTSSAEAEASSERPSWLQSAADDLGDSSSQQDNDNSGLGVAAAGAAIAGGAAVASAFTKSETPADTGADEPQYPREELPFERPRFGARDIEDTSAVSLVDNPLSFNDPSPVETIEEPETPSVELPSTPEEEEQALEEINTALDNDLADADIEALALEAAQASMDPSDIDEALEENNIEELSEENPELHENPISYSSQEDDAFEAQLGALSPSAQAELSSQDAEIPPQEAEVISINSGEEIDASSDVETLDSDIELAASELETPELETVLDTPALPEQTDVLENVVEETETAVPVVEETEIPADTLSLDNALIDLPELEELPTGELASDSAETTPFENVEDAQEAEMGADEISATIDEFNAEIAGIAPTEELETPELDTPELEEVELEALTLPDADLETDEIPQEVEGLEELIAETPLEADRLESKALPELDAIADVEEIIEPVEITENSTDDIDLGEKLEVEGLEDGDVYTSTEPTELVGNGLDDIEESPSLEVEELASTNDSEELLAASELPEINLETEAPSTSNDDLAEIEALPKLSQPEEFEELPSDLELEPLEEITLENDLPDQAPPQLDDIATPEPLVLPDEAPAMAASPQGGMNIQALAAATMSGPASGEMIADIAPPAPLEAPKEINTNGVVHPRLQTVRDALDANKLEDADTLLADIRRDLVQEGDENTPELAELTALAGDHAAASGRPGGAKWLWRLALQRFGEADAIETPAAKAVSERLRQFDN